MKRRFALAEIILVVAIVLLLLLMSLPAWKKAKEQRERQDVPKVRPALAQPEMNSTSN